jgi:asparagine synthase (glutamine-hydrolysing)
MFSLRLVRDGNPALGNLWTDRGLSLQPSAPNRRLRRLLHEFTFKAEYAYDGGMPQWLAKVDGVFARLHPEMLLLGRHKVHHFRLWYRNELAGYVREILLDRRTLSRSYLNGRRLEQIVKQHTGGSANYTMEITGALTAELVHRQLLERY